MGDYDFEASIDTSTPKRRGRPPKSLATTAETAHGAYTETLTYLPGKEDKPETTWCGITFHANVPKEIHAHPEGTPHEKAMHAMIERARDNKFFHVGEFDAAKAVAVREKVTPPKTSEQYRAWVVGWLPGVSSVGELDAKWMSEEGLRIACEVGADDIDFLNTLIAPKRHELSKRDMAA